uniref:Uncharacterized protein n=1 Tax=Panagrolaimus sp. ES5 TaxID=591445 RepID=A0AC34GFI4_9BILA
ANICVYKETHEIHLWILYENATRKMYRIETFNNGEEYNVLRIAEKSGWITFLIDINAKRLAYRLTVNLNNLSEFKTNVIGLEFLGNKIGLVWQPYMEYEKYAFFNETAVNKQKWCHHGKKCSEEVYFDYHFNLCKDANDPAVKFMPGKMEDDPKTKESNPLVIWAIIAAVVVLCAVIIVFLIFYVKYCRKQSKSQSRRMADKPYDRLRKKEEDDEKAQKQSA